MITPVWALTIDKLCERKYDLLMSQDDIKELARNERAKAIDEFLEKICEKYTEEERKRNYKQYCCDIKNELADIAEQLKGGAT